MGAVQPLVYATGQKHKFSNVSALVYFGICSQCVLANLPWLIIWLSMLVTGFVLVPKPAQDVCSCTQLYLST